MPRYDNILETIGHTPLVRLNKLAPANVNIFVKVESFNPLGSIKDRMALAIIEEAERSGELAPGQTVIEATSGNTGLGLAMVCAQKGYPLVVTMAESFSIERRKMLRYLGAKVVLTPASEKGTGMLNKAAELAEKHGWFLCRQFENPANADVHTRTTAREIIDDFGDDKLHVFVSGFGTGGTLLGIARGLKAADSTTRIVAAEPDNAQLLGSGIPQTRDADGVPLGSHPNFRPHLMQGWTPDFISRLTESALEADLVDEIVPVSGSDAMRLSRELACREGIFVGTSSGATLAAALQIAHGAEPGTNIVCMLPDTGERYLSTPLFEDIDVDMNAEEFELSRSTPGCRFDIAPQTTPVIPSKPTPIKELAPQAEALVDKVIADNHVVMFALEWCEFCWAGRKLFARLGIDYKSVDLDTVALQEDDMGGKIRAVLEARTGSPTIPQIYIGGEHIGGCTDLFDEFSAGKMQQRLEACGLAFDNSQKFDPYELLPKWIQPRRSA
jgi:cysteine synthase A